MRAAQVAVAGILACAAGTPAVHFTDQGPHSRTPLPH